MTKILLIDDSVDDRELYTFWLQEMDSDLAISSCEDGVTALQNLTANNFDCVLLDLRLDGEDGMEVLSEIRVLAPSVPVIVLTGQGNERMASEAFVAGAAFYLSKNDLTQQMLGATVNRVIAQSASERELAAKRAAIERSNRLDAVGHLAAGIAHDFNNQLGTLRLCLEMMKNSALPTEASIQIDTALTVVAQSSALATRLVSLSQQGDLLAAEVDACEILEDIKTLASVSISNNTSLQIGRLPEACTVYCDASQFLNAILNLILNADEAIAARPGPGQVLVSSTISEDQSTLRISVKDDGIGMSQETLEKCSDLFFSTKGGRNGTGLGLASAQSFARENGGELILLSEFGSGTEAILTLPIASPQNVEKVAPSEEAVVTAQDGRILLVEDDELLAMMTRSFLRKKGLDVKVVEDGLSALKTFRNQPDFNLVITDIKMPGLSGFELARKLRDESADIPIIYMTGYADNPAHEKEELFGPVLQKPVEPQVLLEAIQTLLRV